MCKTPIRRLRQPASSLPQGDGRERFVSALREGGYLLTSQRLAVAEAVLAADGHICAEHILAFVAEQYPSLKMNKTTVYRALYLFVSLGLVNEIRCGEERAQYELAFRGKHGHLLCSRCDNLIEIDNEVAASLRQEIRGRHGFYIDVDSHPLMGVCSACSA